MRIPSLALPCLALLFSIACAGPSAKRGFVGDDGCKNGESCNAAALLTSAAWHYSYNPDDSQYAHSGKAYGFVPMHWCLPFTPPAPSWVDTSIWMKCVAEVEE